jgi:hypothetical protein
MGDSQEGRVAQPDDAAPTDSQAGDSPRWEREQFIPIRKADLVELLASDSRLAVEHREQFRQLCRLLAATFHYEYHQWLEELKDLYAPFDPDSDTLPMQPIDAQEQTRLGESLFGRFVKLLDRANYRRLSREQIEQAIGVASDWGIRLNVDLESFARLEVFSRGDVVETRTRRRWQNLYRPELVPVPLYQRLVVIFRLRQGNQRAPGVDTRRVYIKLFKNIPTQDLDMLLPGTQFKMSLLDRGKILLPTLSGIAIAVTKIVKGALLLTYASFYGILGLLGLIGGTIGYGVKSFTGYLRTKDKYQLTLTRSLYFQNLDNNAGVIHRLLDEAEEQEFREAILAYALLRRRAGDTGWTEGELDEAAEQFLQERLGFQVDFEVGDALAKLSRLGCASQTPDGRWHAAELADTLISMDRAWDGFFSYHTTTSEG